MSTLVDMARRLVNADVMWTASTIKRARDDKGWSQAKLGKEIGAVTGHDVTGSAVGQWESGGGLSVQHLRALTAIFTPEVLELQSEAATASDLANLTAQTRRRFDEVDAKLDEATGKVLSGVGGGAAAGQIVNDALATVTSELKRSTDSTTRALKDVRDRLESMEQTVAALVGGSAPRPPAGRRKR